MLVVLKVNYIPVR